MCGIAGFIGPPDATLLRTMTGALVHRGPDDVGYLETEGVSLGHRRLSIIDIEHGQQPMANAAGTVHLAYNGELYNFRELRVELEQKGWEFRTTSDTEVFLAAYECWGTACFERANGMWAVAIVDRREGTGRVVLARDHFGIKPLYLADAGGRLLFGSEIKALFAEPELVVAADEARLVEYLVRGLHDHDEQTFFAGVRQILPGTAVTIDLLDSVSVPTVARYYEPTLSSEPALGDPVRFRAAFRLAVERRLVADVPVGTCLSGGLDSSSIVMVMSELLKAHVPDAASMGDRLKTFSAVFDGDPIDEQAYIEPVLSKSGAERNFVRPQAPELFDDLPLFVWHQDEPIVSSGPYAQFRVMRLAQGKAKVLLDGQAGDELLAGYVPYHLVFLRELAKRRRWRQFVKEALGARDVLLPLARAKVANRRRSLATESVLGKRLRSRALMDAARRADQRVTDNLKVRLLQDLTTYSLPSLLRYEDRNSMAYSIESRVPFLDQDLVELVLRLPPEAMVRDGWSRWIVRESLADVLPDKVRLRRKKIGFTTPETRWLRSQRAVVQGIIRSPGLARSGFIDVPALATAFARSCAGEVEPSPAFWRALNIEAWRRVFLAGEGRPVRPPTRTIFEIGDNEAAQLAGTKSASRVLESGTPNPAHHLFMCGPDAESIYARVPRRTTLVTRGDDLAAVVVDSVVAGGDGIGLEPGDIVAVSEKIVAISQGRSFPVADVSAGRLATLLARGVGRSEAGIGLGMPETMQLAIDEAGAGRMVCAAAVGVLGRIVGRRGDFYRVAGNGVNAIDGPTRGTIPPYDTHAKLPPADPSGVARGLATSLSKIAGGEVGVAIVDANDRGVQVLGASDGIDSSLVTWLFADNPLGQGAQQTPVAVLRRVDEPEGASGGVPRTSP